MNEPFVTLDVREDLKSGRDPLAKILDTVRRLGPGQGLRLVAPFQPAPLCFVLGKMGFGHRDRLLDPGSWEVLFEREPANATPDPEAPVAAAAADLLEPPNFVEVDARGLEPPQPMVAILEALAALPDWAELHARTDRRPVHLYPQLEARGFAGETEELPDGSFITRIRAAA